MNFRIASLAVLLALGSTHAAQSACTDLSVPRWTITSVSSSTKPTTGTYGSSPRSVGKVYLKRFNLSDSTGKNRGFVVLNGARTYHDTIPGPFPTFEPIPMTTTDTVSVEESMEANSILMTAFSQGWKLTRISNSSKPFSGTPCHGLAALNDTLYGTSRYSFEFQR